MARLLRSPYGNKSTPNVASGLRFTRALRHRFHETIRRMNATDGIVNTGEDMERIRIEQHTFMGTVWFAAWLSTIGFLHLDLWRGVLSIVLWSYCLGVHLSTLLH
jgi:hypothetical protein